MAITKVKKNIHSLRALCCLKPKQAKAVLATSDKDLVCCLCECLYNVSLGNVPVGPKALSTLKKNKSKIRKIISKETSLKEKKKLLEQSGGFLPLVLAPIVSLIGGLVGEAIGGAISKR